jgi:hypothetical protein
MHRYCVLLVVVMGCHPNPKIKSFAVRPVGYCPGTRAIHVEWDTAKGDTTLQIEPDDPKPRHVSARGSTDFPPHDATVTLTVRSGALAPHVTQPVRAAVSHPLNGGVTEAGGGKCQDGWVTADPTDFGGGPNAYAADAHPSVISNKCSRDAASTATCRRHVKVQHAGLTWSLDPNSEIDVAAATAPMAGSWVLSQELLPGEACGSPSASHAIEVDLSLKIDCAKGVSYEQ